MAGPNRLVDQPRIDGLRIIPVQIGPRIADYCYVVDVPQSSTAHQAIDRRYYKRRNFECTPMEDYEIRDMMNRQKRPALLAAVRVNVDWTGEDSKIIVRVENTSRVMARYYRAVVHMPLRLPMEDLFILRKLVLKPKMGWPYGSFLLAMGSARLFFQEAWSPFGTNLISSNVLIQIPVLLSPTFGSLSTRMKWRRSL